MKSVFTAIVAALALSGCATYTLNGKQYSGSSDFLAASKELSDEAINNIQPLPAALTKKKLIFAQPTVESMIQNFMQMRAKNSPNAAPVDTNILNNLAKNDRNFSNAYGKAIERRNIYTSVSFVTLESSSSIPEASDGVDVLYVISADAKPSQWYYVNKRGGRQIFAFDRATGTPNEGVKAFVDAAQAYALRD